MTKKPSNLEESEKNREAAAESWDLKFYLVASCPFNIPITEFQYLHSLIYKTKQARMRVIRNPS